MNDKTKEQLVFYTTVGCHLCDQAKAILQEALHPDLVAVREVDIADDDMLIERYGVRIPVLMREMTGDELGWPFSHGDLVEFFGKN